MPETLERIALRSSETPKYTSEPQTAAYEVASTWVTKGESVLDLACDTSYVENRAGTGRFIGVDYSSEGVEHARTHVGESHRTLLAMSNIQPPIRLGVLR